MACRSRSPAATTSGTRSASRSGASGCSARSRRSRTWCCPTTSSSAAATPSAWTRRSSARTARSCRTSPGCSAASRCGSAPATRSPPRSRTTTPRRAPRPAREPDRGQDAGVSAPDIPAPDVTATPEWSALAEHHSAVAGLHLRQLFDDDPGRPEALTAAGADLVLDYSKHRITRDTLPLLAAVARAAGLPERTAAMFSGEHINTSEDRAVLHTALRLPRDAGLAGDGPDGGADGPGVLGRL